jgi:hypothetical protein
MNLENAERAQQRGYSRGCSWALWGFGILLSFGFCFGLGFAMGLGIGEQRKYTEQYHRERELVAPILASDPAFTEIAISQRSNGGIWLSGVVPTPQDISRLRESLIRAVGALRTEQLLSGIRLRS